MNWRLVLLTTFGLLTAGTGTHAWSASDSGRELLKEQEQDAISQRMSSGRPGMQLTTGAAQTSEKSEFCFRIREINISGVTKLDKSTLGTLAAPLENSCVGQKEVELLMAGLARAYKEKGFITAQAYIPEQDLTKGTLSLIVVEGEVEAVDHLLLLSDGKQKRVPSWKTQTVFPGLQGHVLQLRDIEQGTAQINASGASQATIDIAPGQKPGGSVVRVLEKQGRRTHATISTDIATNPEGDLEKRISFQLSASDLLRLNEKWSLSYAGSLDSNAIAGSLSVPYGYWTFGVTGSASDQRDEISPVADSISQSGSLGLSVDRVIYRDANYILHAVASGNLYASQRYINVTALSPQKEISGRLGSVIEAYFDGRQYYADAGFTYGRTQIGSGSGAQSYDYAKLDTSFQASVKINESSLLQFSANGQFSSDELPSDQQMSIGGWSGVRAFPTSGASGDSGIFGKVEYQRALELPQALARSSSPFLESVAANIANTLVGYAFVDGGVTYSNQSENTLHLASAGVGFRLSGSRTSMDSSLSVPIASSSSVDSGLTARVSLSVSLW